MSLTTRLRIDHRHLTGDTRPRPPTDKKPGPAPPPPPSWRRWLIPTGIAVTIALLFLPSVGSSAKSIDYTTFHAGVTKGKVASVTIDSNGEIDGKFKGGKEFHSAVPVALDTQGVLDGLTAKGVDVKAVPAHSSLIDILVSLLPLIFLVGLFVYFGRAQRKMGGGLGGLGGIGRSRAKVADMERPSTRFGDVAGYHGVKQEVTEVVDFLKHPQRYHRAGAKGPRGVLMVGPPGTGKTLLARAIAGESSVPFFSVTGSSFVEMFVGVGSARVRDLFEQARKRGPAIIFIDEIDAIGGKRGGGGPGGFGHNDEREQTLNQLLAEMDGFDVSQDGVVVVIAATNRPDVLDPALCRPGRFDRQVSVPLPTQPERAAILAVHARGKTLAPDTDLGVVARATPGFSGADLASLVNEGAIFAVRDNRDVITAADLMDARDRILIGRRDDSNVLLDDEKHSVAVHESGHALVAAMTEHGDPVAKVTILPAGVALGVTEQLPEAERHLYSEGYLRDLLAIRLGGRAAELVVFGEGSTGAANDLKAATEVATRMVREFGLSPELGPVGYSVGGQNFLGSEQLVNRSYAERTQRVIDKEVARLLREAEERAVTFLRERRDALDLLTSELLEREIVDGSVVEAALRGASDGELAGARDRGLHYRFDL